VSRRIESHLLAGPAGKLESLLEEPEEGEPREAVVVCHPHPLHGGTMHNKVVYRLARGLRQAARVVVRFNFRGVNLSEGTHDHGAGEVEDARFILEWLRDRYPDLPWSLAGFSFGARVILKLGCEVVGARRMIAVGYPTRHPPIPGLQTSPTERVFLHSTHDEHGPRDEIERVVSSLDEPKRLILIEAEDHFFAGALDRFEAAVRAL
jgi:alpha/beta superfamily hydrolase